MVPLGCPETSVKNCHYLLRNIQEELSSHLLRRGSLKSTAYAAHISYHTTFHGTYIDGATVRLSWC